MNYNLLFPILIILVFYLFLIRPQMKEKKAFEKMLSGLKKGDKVLTNSGIFAEVYAIRDENKVTLKVAENVRIDFSKSSISKIIVDKKDNA